MPKRIQRRYAVLVVWKNGDEEYLHAGMGDKTAIFPSRQRAQDQADFMRMGMADEVQSINVVTYSVAKAAHF